MQQKFLSRFSQLLENGFSIADALAIMKTLFKKQAVDPMIIACLQGQNFADTLEECHFEHRIIYMIRSSEQAGALLQGLQKAADYSDFHLKNRSDLSKKIRYPLTLFGLM
ncbi:type II secretion protein F, partial [Turicibacter sanguinis]|nr:type II secretion protein F [Turicibacter sanguinis]